MQTEASPIPSQDRLISGYAVGADADCTSCSRGATASGRGSTVGSSWLDKDARPGTSVGTNESVWMRIEAQDEGMCMVEARLWIPLWEALGYLVIPPTLRRQCGAAAWWQISNADARRALYPTCFLRAHRTCQSIPKHAFVGQGGEPMVLLGHSGNVSFTNSHCSQS